MLFCPINTIRCQRHKSSCYVGRIAVYHWQRAAPLVAKTGCEISHSGEIFSNWRVGYWLQNLTCHVPAILFGRAGIRWVGSRSKIAHHSGFHECLKFESEFVFWVASSEPNWEARPQFKAFSPQCHPTLWLKGQHQHELWKLLEVQSHAQPLPNPRPTNSTTTTTPTVKKRK